MTNNKTVKAIAYCALFFMNCALISSCSADDNEAAEGNSPVAAQISAGIGESLTRAVDTKWTSTDNIGVRVTAATANSSMITRYKNVQYKIKSLSNDNATAEFEAADQTQTSTMIFFQDASETVTFAAYAPYQSSSPNELPGTDGEITGGKTNEKNGSTTDQETIDFIYASGATASKSNSTVSFSGDDHQFKHKMARLVLNVKMSDGFEATDISKITKITLGGLIHEGTFNVTTGTAAASTTASAVDDWDITNVAKTETDNVYTYTMILYPQTLKSALPIAITVTDDNGSQTYSNSTTIQPDLKTGTSYEYTITVKKQGLTISGCTIAAWGSGTGATGDATM